jgi:uncharacterized integral membrane protein
MMTLLSYAPLIIVWLLMIFGGIVIYFGYSEEYMHEHKSKRKRHRMKHHRLRRNSR